MDALILSQERPDTDDVRVLLTRHFELMRASSPEESCHVMAPDTLLEAGASLIGARSQGWLLGIGALTRIGPDHGELKSMHTAAEARGRGVARAILNELMRVARDMGLRQLSLETGSAEMFAPARALYAAHGFRDCPPFGSYRPDPLSVFMTRQI